MARGKRLELPQNKLRSALTNGTSILAGNVDHRQAWVKRLRDLIVLHSNDLGGDDNITEAERRLVRRAAMLTLQLELQEQRFAQNDGEASPRQLVVYQMTSNTLRRLLQALGLQRRQKDVTPTLQEYLARSSRGEEYSIDAEAAE